MTGLVLVHGGMHDSRCWTPTVDALAAQAPGTRVVAVDLPGRGRNPDGLLAYSLDSCLAAIEQQAAALDEFVLVGHSAAGLVLPAAAHAFGADRVRRVVYVSCFVPPEGGTIAGALRGPLRPLAVLARRWPRPMPPLRRVGAWAFCNGMTAAQRVYSLSTMCAESPRLTAVRTHRAGLSRTPSTWVLLGRDRALPPSQQRLFVDRLGGVDDVVALDTCHNAMIAEPDALARILLTAAER